MSRTPIVPAPGRVDERRAPYGSVCELLTQACCVTLVSGLGVDETLRRLDAEASTGAWVCLDELVRTAYADHLLHPSRQLAGVAALEGWTLVLEPNGYACSDRRVMSAVSVGTTTVTLCHDADDDELTVMTDGRRTYRLLLRAGPTAAPLPRADAAAGDAFWAGDAAALVERFTGLRLSAELVGGLRYRTGSLDLG